MSDFDFAAPWSQSFADPNAQAANDNAPQSWSMFDTEAASSQPIDGAPATPAGTPAPLDYKMLAMMYGLPWPGDAAAAPVNGNAPAAAEAGPKKIESGSVTASVTPGSSLAVAHTKSVEKEYSEQVSSKKTNGQTVEYGAGGAKIGISKGDEKKVGNNVHATGVNAGAGIDKDGHWEVTAGKSDKKEDEKGATDKSNTVGITDKGIKFDHDKTVEKKSMVGDKEVKESKQNAVGVVVGPDTFGVDAKHVVTNKDGSKSATNGGLEIEDGNIKGNVGQTFTDARGNSASLSLSGGISVVCGDPVQVGKRWTVSYKRSSSVGGGAGGSSHGASLSLGATHDNFEEGTRFFDSKEEAAEFKEHAAEKIGNPKSPITLDGVKDIPIGESRGEGGTTGGNIGGSVALEGASFGGDKSKSKTTQVDVKRLSENVVEATYYESDDGTGGLHAGGLGITTGAGTKSSEHSGITCRFDISNAEGQQAFEKFCSDHKAPEKGGQFVNKEHGLDDGSHDGTSVVLLGSGNWEENASEKTVTDAKGGVHQTFTGETKYDLNAKWLDKKLGDTEKHEAIDLKTHVDDGRLTGATIEEHISGEDGGFNRDELKKLAGSHEKSAGDAKASGDWTVSADIPLEMMKDYEIGHHGTASQNGRELAHDFANKGDNASKLVNEIESFGTRDPKAKQKQLDWNVELKGDPNFTGKTGRMVNDAKVELYTGLVANTAASATTAEGLQTEIEQLRIRRNAVDPKTNPDQYTDLPVALRQGELGHIDGTMAQLEELRHRSALEAMKNNPGESSAAIDARVKDNKEDPNKTPEERQLAGLRDELAQLDAMIAEHDANSLSMTHNIESMSEVIAKGDVDWKHFKKELRPKFEADKRDGKAQYDVHQRFYMALDDQRVAFLKMLTTPSVALVFGQSLLGQVRAQLTVAMQADQTLTEAYDTVMDMTDEDDNDDAADQDPPPTAMAIK